MGLCAAKAESHGFDTIGAARFVTGWVRRHGSTSGEDLVDRAKEHGFTCPDGRAFGAVFQRCIREGWLKVLRSDLPRRRGHSTSGGRLYGVPAADSAADYDGMDDAGEFAVAHPELVK